jgi:hypothetical protein
VNPGPANLTWSAWSKTTFPRRRLRPCPGSWVIGVIAHKGNDQGTMLRRAHRAHAAAHRTRHHPYRRSGFTLYAFEADMDSLLAFLPGCRCWRVLRPRLTPSRPPFAGTTESRPEHGGNSTQRGLSRSTAPKTRRHEPNRTIAAERRIQRRRRGPGTIITSSPNCNGAASTGMSSVPRERDMCYA